MRKFSAVIFVLLMAASAVAQIFNLTITKSNGEKVVIPASEITKIEFVEGAGGENPNLPKADLLDVVFKDDGTAVDVSPMKHVVTTKSGATLMTYYNDVHKRYVASFKNSLGGQTGSGFYRIDYPAGGEFVRRIADGCTFESIVMLGEENPGTKEVKWFSSMQTGGIGFILPLHSRSTNFTFLPNVSETGSPSWKWTHSAVQPNVGKYYHVVGVWNKEEGKAYIYINGVLSGEGSAKGNYVPVQSGAEAFIIGGDPDTNAANCTNAWNGEVVTAKIYDAPLSAEQVAALWKACGYDEEAQGIILRNVQYMQECEVAPDYKYVIYGNGFQYGDRILFERSVGVTTSGYEVNANLNGNAVVVTIPQDFQSGSYTIKLKRGVQEKGIGVVNIKVTGIPALPSKPKVIAHRGEHTGGASENSVAALKKGMDSGYYGVELDVWTTTDGKVVVHHDGNANNVTFQDAEYSAIKDFKLANGETLPTLEDFLAAYKQKMGGSDTKLIIEFKTHSTTDRNNRVVDLTMQQVEAAGLKERVEYIAFKFDVCQRVLAKDANATVGYLNGDKTAAELKSAGVKVMDYKNTVFESHPEWIKEGTGMGLDVNVWTINDPLEMLRYMGRGATYITTDAPATLKEFTGKVFVSK